MARYLKGTIGIWLMSRDAIPKGLKEAGQKMVDNFFDGPLVEPPKPPKELPVKCPRCENFTFASFSACHVCDNPVSGKGKKVRFKYKKITKGY